MAQLRVGQYWKRVLGRAVHDTVHIFDPDKRRILLVPVLFAVGSAVHLAREGLDAVMGEITVALSYGVYAVGIVGIVLFFWNFISAPAKMEMQTAALLEALKRKAIQSPLQIEYTDDCNLDNIQSLCRITHVFAPVDRDEMYALYEYRFAINNTGQATVRNVCARIYFINQPDRAIDWRLPLQSDIRPQTNQFVCFLRALYPTSVLGEIPSPDFFISDKGVDEIMLQWRGEAIIATQPPMPVLKNNGLTLRIEISGDDVPPIYGEFAADLRERPIVIFRQRESF